MTPRPWYRSRLFWLGLPGLVFLLWGWGISFGHLSSAESAGDANCGVSQSAGDVVVFWVSDGLPSLVNLRTSHWEQSSEQARGWKLTLAAMDEATPAFNVLTVPYYKVVLAYGVQWLLALAWWQRRKSRLLELHAAP